MSHLGILRKHYTYKKVFTVDQKSTNITVTMAVYPEFKLYQVYIFATGAPMKAH